MSRDPGELEVWVTAVGVVSRWGTDPAAIPGDGIPAGEAPGIDLDALLAGLSEKHLRHADRAGLLSAGAARLALQSAGLAPPQAETGIVLGVDYGAYPANLAHQRRLAADGAKLVSPAEFTLTLPNITTAFASIALGLRGPTATLADGGTASGSAVGTAFEMIRLGEATSVLAGGVEPADRDCDLALEHFGGGRTPARPEHGVMWLLESAAHAHNAGRTPLARLLDYAAARGPRAGSDDGTGAPPTDLWHLTGHVARGGQSRRTDSWHGPSCAPQVRSLTWESA